MHGHYVKISEPQRTSKGGPAPRLTVYKPFRAPGRGG